MTIIKSLKIAFLVAASAMVAACSTPKNIAYLQDAQTDVVRSINASTGIVIQPQDMLNITVTSAMSPELAVQFNLSTSTYNIGSEIINNAQHRITGYVVDNNGDIDFPVLGALHVKGLNRWELSNMIKEEIISRNYLSDEVVTVEFMNFKISVMGEVAHPGTYSINGDKMTLLEGLSLAGDLTIFGKRENVIVIREDNGTRTVYSVDITSSSMFDSPAYYLKQNDVIIVEPNDIRKRQSTVDDKSMRLTSIGLSAGSLLLTIANIIISVVK